MKVLLVNPPRFNKLSVIREERCEILEKNSVLPPYSLLQVASLLRKRGHEVSLIDANGENINYPALEKMVSGMSYGAVIFRFISATFDWDMQTATISKKYSDAPTIGICWTLGSSAKTVLNEAKNLDIYLRNEYEVVAPELIDRLSAGDKLSDVAGIAYRHEGEIKVNRDASPIQNYDDIPLPAYDLLKSFNPYYADTKHGQPFTIMYTSKGCPNSCIYCTMANTKWKARSAESVIEELRHLKQNYNIKTIMFFDEAFTINRKRVEKITQAIIDERLDIKWYCNSRVDRIDRDLLKKMKQAGCKAVCMGIESGSQKVIAGADKRISVEKSAEAIKMVKDAGIKVYCSFIFGLPGENRDTINETIEFIKRTLPTGGEFNIATPYPGTKLYEIAMEKGWITGQYDFRRMNQNKSIMRTEELTTEEIDRARKQAHYALFLNPRWWAQNIGYVIKNPEDFNLASKYAIGALKIALAH
ncbi:B12-binding domain-containing radical SAM protein [Candidatus Methanoperedens nitratireducens]|uniref:Fe-S oxidoreductase n=1 Tax=Candidatus Methanoperedens nitratireducens TaxID=1392998 RepID=A0A284VQF8_9EURY|nr:radical SAM protein [Candidatus Methanoperedens nitroreducens]SNQ61516.1 Fe-S oxidoreductase [Candidatus Methanoperedens nitroreducens]